jgi:hydroxymethylbilane synthase
MTPRSTLRIGTRGSRLARWQADWVAGQLSLLEIEVEMVLITTQGDARDGPIEALGGQGVFTREIQRALLEDRIDVAVHSLKDLPTEPVTGLGLATVPARESAADVLLTVDNGDLQSLPAGCRVGTGSLRRQAQLLHAHPDLDVQPIRGNVETRIARLDKGEYGAIVLAEAGLKRLELQHRISQVLPATIVLPAVGQGALGLETRSDDDDTRGLLAPLDDPASHMAVIAERALLSTLRGGCLAPIGAWGRWQDEKLVLDAVCLDERGTKRLAETGRSDGQDPGELGQQVAQQLISRGALELIGRS